MTPPIRVTVVGGYLGSGKTTLINSVLARADERIAVLVNDFGEVNIDAALIEQASAARADGQASGVIQLSNGCICCSLADGLASALTTIDTYEPRPARLLIEASGVSDPASIAAYGHLRGFELDAVIVMADAESVVARSRDRYVGDTVTRQLDAADLIVVNKVSLIPDADRTRLMTWLTDRWPDKPTIETDYGDVPIDVLFGPDLTTPRDSQPDAEASSHAAFETWTLRRTEPVSRESVTALMGALPPSIVRAKGFVRLSGDERAILQRVGQRWTLESIPDTAFGPDPIGTVIVLIGEPGAVDPAALDRVVSNTRSTIDDD